MRNVMGWIRQALGYQVSPPSEQATVDQRLQAQRIRLNALDAAIEAQNAAPKRVERRSVPRP